MPLANKITVITGGNSGIGLATARLFAAEGARVAIIGRNAKTLNAAATELGTGVLAVRADAPPRAHGSRSSRRRGRQGGALTRLG